MARIGIRNGRPVLIPGGNHPITIEPNPGRVEVMIDSQVVAKSDRALTLRESTYAPVQYIPRDDVDLSLLERSDHITYCPYKGEAAYYSITSAGERGRNAVWTYEQPHDNASPIRGYLAFYADRVEITQTLLPGTAEHDDR
jgi:uncharacterized protein (DUF427 family)